MTAKAYELHEEDFKSELEKQWKRFLENELKAIVSAFDTGEWLGESLGVKH